MNIKYGKSKRIIASESDGNYDKSFKAKGTTYYIEMLSGAGNYVAKWWDSSDNGLGYNNKGWVAIEGKNYRALNNISDVSSDNIIDLLSVVSDYDRKPGKPIQDRIKREVAKLIDFESINSSCGKKSIKASTYNSIELTFISPDRETGRLVADKAWEIGGFGSTWTEHSWVYVDVPSDQSVDNVDDLIQYAQSVGVYLNRPSAKLLDAWADSKTQTVLRGCTEMPVKASRTLEIYTFDELTPEQQAYVLENWSDMRKLAEVIYDWYNEDIMFGYNDEAQYIADQYASKYGLSINPDKLYWQSNSQGPYPEWDLSQVFDEYQLNDGTEIYFYGRGLDVEAEADSWGEEVESPEIDEVVGHAQEYIDEMWSYINEVCQAYPDDEWVAQCFETNPESFEFTISDSGEVKYY